MKSLAGDAVVEANVSAESIWRLLRDVTQMGRWSPECKGATWLNPPSDSLSGRRFRGSNRAGLLRWSTTCTILVADPGRLLTFDARHWSGATTRWTFEIKPTDQGTTVRESFRTINSPAVMIALERLAGRPRRLRSAMRTTLERLCAEAKRTTLNRPRDNQV